MMDLVIFALLVLSVHLSSCALEGGGSEGTIEWEAQSTIIKWKWSGWCCSSSSCGVQVMVLVSSRVLFLSFTCVPAVYPSPEMACSSQP
ncbi:hypothetical protein IWX90DRAFT_425287 [Phyllosticta citrichinensis]|uniref:Secreted protein n=1 Tax=Phyllosticta citrichinensis TaxID=1130410 RepID=A0ABR1Y4D7_9PEZI